MAPAARNPSVACAWESLTIEELFAECGALLDGHFLLTSGRHAARYLEKFFVLQHPSAAVEIGRRLARLARSSQVLVVTHLPQVAAYADRHLLVTKADDGMVTVSGVRRLDDDGRLRELARMLAGLDQSDTALAHAEELLAAAQKDVAQLA